MSKIVTATAANRLVDEGRLDLFAPADEYVDYLRVPGTPNVGQLLNHTAGFGNPMPIRWVHPAGADPPDPEALLRRLMGRRRACRHPAGQGARYSHVGYLAAGKVIAAASGVPFETYVHDSVLRPVGMEHTGFRYPDGEHRATGYVKAPRIVDPVLRGLLPGGVAGDHHGPYLSLDPLYVDGPAYGGLVGDVLDAGRFLRLHLRDGEIDGTRVLSPSPPAACAPLTRRVSRSTTEPAGFAGRRTPRGSGWSISAPARASGMSCPFTPAAASASLL